jgi:hypothetical protein
MKIPQDAIDRIKENLRQRREQMIKLLELERAWPQADDEQLIKLQNFIQQKEAIIRQLETIVQQSSLPKHGLEAWLEQLPVSEREDIGNSLKMLRELSVLTLDWHHKNVGSLNLRAQEIAKVLTDLAQEKSVIKALRQTMVPAARMNWVG